MKRKSNPTEPSEPGAVTPQAALAAALGTFNVGEVLPPGEATGAAMRHILSSTHLGSIAISDALANGPAISDALKAALDGPSATFAAAAGAINSDVFDRIRDTGQNTRRMLDGLELAAPRFEPPDYSDVFPLELGPSAEEQLLDGLRQDMADLRAITAAQATNVALQAELAKAQTAKLDELIAAIHVSTETTERLERTALRVAITAIWIALIPYWATVADILRPVARDMGLL